MKSLPLLLTLTLSAVISNSYSQIPETRKELVVHCRDLSQAQVNSISRQLKCVEGVHLAGYYLPAHCLFITYDESKVAKSSVITSVLFGLNKRMKASTVKGYTIYDIIDKGMTDEFFKDQRAVFTPEER